MGGDPPPGALTAPPPQPGPPRAPVVVDDACAARVQPAASTRRSRGGGLSTVTKVTRYRSVRRASYIHEHEGRPCANSFLVTLVSAETATSPTANNAGVEK